MNFALRAHHSIKVMVIVGVVVVCWHLVWRRKVAITAFASWSSCVHSPNFGLRAFSFSFAKFATGHQPESNSFHTDSP